MYMNLYFLTQIMTLHRGWLQLFVYFYILSLFLDNRGSQVTEGKVLGQFMSHYDIKIHVWKYIRLISMGLDAFLKEKLDNQDRALSP